jgi:hypothetical protein
MRGPVLERVLDNPCSKVAGCALRAVGAQAVKNDNITERRDTSEARFNVAPLIQREYQD